MLASGTYCMGAIFHSLKMNHTIEAGKGCAATLVTMTVEFLLREDVSAALCKHQNDSFRDMVARCFKARWGKHTSQEKETIVKKLMRWSICGMCAVTRFGP